MSGVAFSYRSLLHNRLFHSSYEMPLIPAMLPTFAVCIAFCILLAVIRSFSADWLGFFSFYSGGISNRISAVSSLVSSLDLYLAVGFC